MAVTSPDLEIDLFLSDDATELLIEDNTGSYSVDNTGGYGLSGGPSTSNVTSNTITLNYTQLGTTLEYVFTVAGNVITAATASLASATPVNILSELSSTVWPFTSSNPFNLIGDYGVTLPSFDDGAYTATYRIQGSVSAESFDFSTTDQELVSTDVCCCISEKSLTYDINDTQSLVKSLIPAAYLAVAGFANEAGETTLANSYLNKATDLCDCDCC